MPRYKAICGKMNEIVEAESHLEAAEKLFTMFDDDPVPPEVGEYVSTIEVTGEELWQKSEGAIKRAGRWGIDTDASTAEKPSSENQSNSG